VYTHQIPYLISADIVDGSVPSVNGSWIHGERLKSDWSKKAQSIAIWSSVCQKPDFVGFFFKKKVYLIWNTAWVIQMTLQIMQLGKSCKSTRGLPKSKISDSMSTDFKLRGDELPHHRSLCFRFCLVGIEAVSVTQSKYIQTLHHWASVHFQKNHWLCLPRRVLGSFWVVLGFCSTKVAMKFWESWGKGSFLLLG